MREVLLILVMAAAFGFLFYVMCRLDRFIYSMHPMVEDTPEVPEPSCVLLSEDLDDEEFTREARRFRQAHRNAPIILSEKDGKQS